MCRVAASASARRQKAWIPTARAINEYMEQRRAHQQKEAEDREPSKNKGRWNYWKWKLLKVCWWWTYLQVWPPKLKWRCTVNTSAQTETHTRSIETQTQTTRHVDTQTQTHYLLRLKEYLYQMHLVQCTWRRMIQWPDSILVCQNGLPLCRSFPCCHLSSRPHAQKSPFKMNSYLFWWNSGSICPSKTLRIIGE